MGVILLMNVIFGCIYVYQYHQYTIQFNQKLEGIIKYCIDEYHLNRNAIMDIINQEQTHSNILLDYGIDLNKDAILLKNEQLFHVFFVSNLLLVTLTGSSVLVLFFYYHKKQSKELDEILYYIQEINKKNYLLHIDDNTEDELSILKNELYKTTIMLKEQAENLKLDKYYLKNSIDDISHQLKTPLTSILVLIDNIIDNPNMDQRTRKKFIGEIKKKTLHIRFLIYSLLKLSRFDVDVIEYHNTNVNVKTLLEQVIEHVSILCDLYNVNICIHGLEDVELVCDMKWQTEALTNIVKNAVEYSCKGGYVDITYTQNKIYTMICIQDYGRGISNDDQKHIFERFYKSKNASKDGIGIGLPLAKMIIEKNNGQIFVESQKDKGTKFIIKYYKESVS